MPTSDSNSNDDIPGRGDSRDYKLDISGLSDSASESRPQPRPFISVHFECCNVYQRIYRSADGKAYQGRCPRCGKTVSFKVGEGGTASRFFRAS